MSVTSTRNVTVGFSGDVITSLSASAADNPASPGSVTIYTFVLGFNLITLPTGGTTVVGATIVPPQGNVETLTLKGISGDTGVPMHPTDPCSITFAAGTTTFGIEAGGTVTGLRIIWS